MSGRETAWRVLANELQASLFEEKGVGDRAASYLLSPLGARMNRVAMWGRLSSAEPAGSDPARPFVRARLTDPTGSVSVTGGSFQPRALTALQRVEPDRPYFVVGKAHLFVGRTGAAYPSVRAEALASVDDPTMRAGWAEAAAQTLDRVELLEQLRGGAGGPRRPDLPSAWIAGANAAQAKYPAVDPASFRSGLRDVLQALAPGATPDQVSVPPAPAGTGARVTRLPPATVPSTPVSAAGRAQESAFLDIIDELSERSVDGYADLREAIGLAGRRGVRSEEAEELLNRLEESGILEEPVVGKLRRA